MSGYKGNNIVDPIAAPTLNQHREAILHEFMAPRDSYVPSHREADDEAGLDRPDRDISAAKISAE